MRATAAKIRRILLILLLAQTGFGCSDAESGLLEQLSHLNVDRRIAGRLSISSAHRPCTQVLARDAAVPHTRCDEEGPTESELALTKKAAAAHSATLNGDTLHAVALSDLIWGRSSDMVLHRVIESLETAARLTDHPAPVLADLAAARIERAEHTQRLHDLLEAVEIADSALMLEPRNPIALFNLALGLERLGLDGEADRAWARYLEVDASSGWAHEATRRRRELARPPPPQRSLLVDMSATAVDSLVRRAPQKVRELGWEMVLDDWGAALLRDDTAYATDRLALAEALGNALVRTGGDGTLAEAVKDIRLATNDVPVLRGLAAAHRAYAAGQRAYLSLDHTRADAEFRRVETLRPPSRTLLLWSSVFRGATLFYLGERERGESLVQRVATVVDEQRAAALAGRARWNLGTMRLRTGRYSASVPEYLKASHLLIAVREWENAGAVEYGLGEANFALGDRAASDSILLRGAARLRPYRSSRWLHGLLLVTANVATSSRLRRAAAHIHDEDVRVAARTGLALYELEARANRARFMAVSDDTAAITRDLVSSRRLLPSVSDPRARGWVENDLRLARSAVLLRSSPKAAITVLDSVAEFLRARDNPLVLIPALQARAEASLALGDADAAAPHLDSATTLLGSLNTKVEQTALRVSMLDRGRELFDRLAMLRISQGRPEEAFAVVERGRVSLSRQGSAASGQPAAPRQAPPGETLLSYALVGDTLLVWTIVGDSVQLARTTPGRTRLLSILDRLHTGLERHVGAAQVRGDLAALYELLVRPAEGRLEKKWVIVADGEVARAPFAALFDAQRQRYVVQDHVIRYASSLQDAHTDHASTDGAEGVLLVADPAFDTRRFDGGRLPNARAEVDSIRRAYPRAEVLQGDSATTPALLEALSHAGLVHFAGHAVFDDERPELSYLLLAPSHRDDGRLTAAQIDTMKLDQVRLMVLSSCRTIGRTGRSGAFAGLAGALLGAGVHGVVGSLWLADDRLTVPVMTAFHHEFRTAEDGAEALARAQVALIGSSDPALSSPATWAGFRYAGR